MAKPPQKKPAKPAAKSSNVVAQARGSQNKGSMSPLARWLWENFKSLVGAVIIYLFVKTLLVEAYRIPSGSMIPTLLVGDWLFVNKLAYGPTIPFTNSHLPGYADPKHGDVVVFVSPYQADNGNDPTPVLVKRLIGMPGDTLYMRDGQLFLNGVAQHQNLAEPNAPGDNSQLSDDFAWQRTAEIKGSRFGAPPAQTHARQLGAAQGSARSLFHDGRQPVLLQGQSVLGHRPAGQHSRSPAVRVLLLSPRRGAGDDGLRRTGQRSARAVHQRHPLGAPRTLDQVVAGTA